MARPDRATLLSYTSSGVPFQWLIDNYKDKGAHDANVSVMNALVGWEEADDFLRDAVGYTEWDGSSTTLQRTLPLGHPFRDGLWCDEYEVVDLGAYPERVDFNDPFNDNAPDQDWLVYQLTFRRPPYWMRDDETIRGATFASKEKERYCTYGRRYIPRERRRSGFAFQYQKAPVPPATEGEWATVPDESAFIPDFQVEYLVTWKQVPIGAVPEAAIRSQLITVNSAPFKLRAEQKIPFAAGELLFKGPAAGIDAYAGADLLFYSDLDYVFAFQAGGWNRYLRPDLVTEGGVTRRDYGDIRRRKNGAPDGSGDPPYPSSDFDLLFRPGAGV
ncbi:MAG TPA: hypothetical protein VGE74_26990 [Gemmata sp.]